MSSWRDKLFAPSPSDRGAYADGHGRPDDREKEDRQCLGSYDTDHCAHHARRVDDDGVRRPDARRATEDAGKHERWHDARAYEPLRASDSLAASKRRDDRRSEPRRDWHDVSLRQQGGHRTGHDEPQGCHRTGRDERRASHTAHSNSPLPIARGEARHHDHAPVGTNRGGRPSAMQIALNKRIVAARDAESILTIVTAEHGEFNAVNVATA